MKLSELKVKESGKIIKIYSNSKMLNRLNNLGLISGAKVKIIRKMAFGGPTVISVKGYFLALREKDLRDIEIEYE